MGGFAIKGGTHLSSEACSIQLSTVKFITCSLGLSPSDLRGIWGAGVG